MQTLKDLCKEGHTVISSIHQPRSSIFAMFDDLILLSEGRMLYSGPASEALSYFEELGHHCPQHYNPAEFLADLISVDASNPEAQQETRYAMNAHGRFCLKTMKICLQASTGMLAVNMRSLSGLLIAVVTACILDSVGPRMHDPCISLPMFANFKLARFVQVSVILYSASGYQGVSTTGYVAGHV